MQIQAFEVPFPVTSVFVPHFHLRTCPSVGFSIKIIS